MGLTDDPMEEPQRSAIRRFASFLFRIGIRPTNTNEDIARREYILNVILAGAILMLAALDGMVLYHALLYGWDYPGVSFAQFSGLLLFFVALYALSRRGYFVASSYFLIAALLLDTTYAAYRWGAALPVALLAYALIVYASGILVSTAFGFAMTALTTCLLTIVWHLHISGLVVAQPQYPTEDDILVFAIFYFLIMGISWLSNREIEKSLTRARRSEAALKEERDLLETRVTERTDELRRVQFKEIEQIHRFAGFGKLASGLFHDVLNLLNAISLRTEGNSKEETALAEAYSTTRQIQQFMRGLQRQLGEKDSCGSFSLIEGIEEAIQLIAHKAGKANVHIIFPHDARDPFIYSGTPFKFHQIVINLLSNAIDSYHSFPESEHERYIVTINVDAQKGFFVLSVKDQGCGIPIGSQRRIFEPFFTTKDKMRGSGIGLASIKKIIEEDLHGTIDVESTEGAGALFTVKFPAIAPSSSGNLPSHHENRQHENNPPGEQ
ncbi:MAG: ATP-binding protein [Candidatus Pacebacteria bacterium]|nr:ATP-binding protein [Candidatus Paceibacterota bacterium]